MNKTDLRKQKLKERKLLTAFEINYFARIIAKRILFYFDFKQIKAIHIFLPIEKNNEFNTYPIIEEIQSNFPEIKIMIPVSNFETNTMRNALFTSTNDLKANKYGIQEPRKPIFLDDVVPDIVFTPLLTFDRNGYRVGYGGGFYDRYFENMPKKTKKVGLSVEEGIYEISDVHRLDQPLDYAFTPLQVLSQNQR